MPFTHAVLCATLAAAQALAARTPPDFSGRWSLVRVSDGGRPAASTPSFSAAKEILVSQDAGSLTVEHRTPGEYPKATTHRFTRSGMVTSSGERMAWDVFWFGDQLIISNTTTVPDGDGRRTSHGFEEMWSLEKDGRLVIHFSEKKAGDLFVRGTLMYGRRKTPSLHR